MSQSANINSHSLLSLLTSSQRMIYPLAHCPEVRQNRARLTSHLLHHPGVWNLLEAATPHAEDYSCTSLGPGRCFPVRAGRTHFLLHRFINCPRGAEAALEAVLGEARVEVEGEERDSEVDGEERDSDSEGSTLILSAISRCH